MILTCFSFRAFGVMFNTSRCQAMEAIQMCGKENPWKYFRSRRISIHSCLRTQIGCLLTQISAQISRAFYSSKIVHPFMVLSIKVDVARYTRLLYLLNYPRPSYLCNISALSLFSLVISYLCAFFCFRTAEGRSPRYFSEKLA